MPAAPSLAAAPRPAYRTISGVFAPNRTITDALRGHGFGPQQVFELVRDARPVHDLARVTAGRSYWIEVDAAGGIHSFRYPLDDERHLTVRRQGDHYEPAIRQVPYDTRVEGVWGEIRDSLLAAVAAAGEQERLGLELADIFMWDIDFYTELQPGDSFRLLVEKKFLDGRFVKYGPILAAEFVNRGRKLTAFRFDNQAGRPEYFNAAGESLKRSFLRSPLKFARISSRFSRSRLHPIMRVFRPHYGVDYAAPAGTPVVAVGDGTVVAAGPTPQGGMMVRLRHAGGYETYYLHLSRMTVRAGESVRQHQIIGHVGATGLATGPHLDFRVAHHGRFINPAKVIFPPSPPVAPAELARFAAARDPLRARLEGMGF